MPGSFPGIQVPLPAALTVCALAVVVRFAGSSGEERLQLTWFAAAAAVLGVTLIPRILTDSAASTIVMDLAVICLEVTIAVAVLRYRLYDLDIVISRAVLYAILAAFITAVYVVLVAGVGAAAGARSSTLLSAVAAAVVAVAFQPVRARAARLANLVVYGRGHALPGALRLRRADRRRLLERGRAARHGPCGGGGHRGAPRRGLADGWRRAARRRLHRPVPAGDGAARAPRAGRPARAGRFSGPCRGVGAVRGSG